jgi:hypothetical protein
MNSSSVYSHNDDIIERKWNSRVGAELKEAGHWGGALERHGFVPRPFLAVALLPHCQELSDLLHHTATTMVSPQAQ